MRPIERAETAYSPLANLQAAERVVASHWIRRDVARFAPKGLSSQPLTFAEVNHGRWIVRCPFCASAQFASQTDHRFFCVECLNESVGRRWVRVAWPTEPEIAGIEAALLARPALDVMHWRPGESAADLLRENAEHGVASSG